MSQIMILGLGPGEWKQLTLEAAATLNSHKELWLRTRHHPLVGEMPAHLAIHSFDHLYEEIEEFDALYRQIAREVVRLGQREEGVLYAVPGHPWVGEATVGHIVALARAEQVPLRFIEGMSFIEPSLTVVQADALDGLQIADATAVARRHHPPFDAARPVLIAQLYSRMVAADLKLVLMELYPAEHPVTLLNGVGTGQADVLTMPLYQLDHHSHFAYLTSLWLPALPIPTSLPQLHDVIAHLRSPEGCPWDQEQDFQTLRPFILEEAYEVVEAIDQQDPGELRDELGDLLGLILMNAQIASEGGDFNMADVITAVSQKLIRRHPHVFGTTEVSDAEEVVRNWDAIKGEERAEKGEEQDPFERIPAALPALQRAQKVIREVTRQGGEVPEVDASYARWQQAPEDEEALGELLLALAAQAAARKQDSERLLRAATARLVGRQQGGQGKH